MAISILGLEFFVQKIPTDQGWSIFKVRVAGEKIDQGSWLKNKPFFELKKTKI